MSYWWFTVITISAIIIVAIVIIMILVHGIILWLMSYQAGYCNLDNPGNRCEGKGLSWSIESYFTCICRVICFLYRLLHGVIMVFPSLPFPCNCPPHARGVYTVTLNLLGQGLWALFTSLAFTFQWNSHWKHILSFKIIKTFLFWGLWKSSHSL